jgi:H+/Cl- antiporter ClcA
MAVLGFALGLYLGIFGHLLVDALPDMYSQLTHENVPLYTVYIMIFVVSFASFYIGRKARKLGRR